MTTTHRVRTTLAGPLDWPSHGQATSACTWTWSRPSPAPVNQCAGRVARRARTRGQSTNRYRRRGPTGPPISKGAGECGFPTPATKPTIERKAQTSAAPTTEQAKRVAIRQTTPTAPSPKRSAASRGNSLPSGFRTVADTHRSKPMPRLRFLGRVQKWMSHWAKAQTLAEKHCECATNEVDDTKHPERPPPPRRPTKTPAHQRAHTGAPPDRACSTPFPESRSCQDTSLTPRAWHGANRGHPPTFCGALRGKGVPH